MGHPVDVYLIQSANDKNAKFIPAVPVSADVHGRWHNDGVVGGEGSGGGGGAVVILDGGGGVVVVSRAAVEQEQVVDNVPVADQEKILTLSP